MRLQLKSLAIVLASSLQAGCGDGSEGPALAPVSGVVTLNDKPVDGATVIFSPKGEAPMSMAITDMQGKFTLTTGSNRPGAAVGDHAVGVALSMTTGGTAAAAVDPLANAPLTESEAAGGRLPGKVIPPRTVWIVPEKYSKPESSGLTATVPSAGLSDYKLDLKK